MSAWFNKLLYSSGIATPPRKPTGEGAAIDALGENATSE
jgi:hypothetical protein